MIIHLHSWIFVRFLLAGTQQNDVGLTGYNSLQNFSSKSNVINAFYVMCAFVDCCIANEVKPSFALYFSQGSHQ